MILPEVETIQTESKGHVGEYAMKIDEADQGIIFEFLRNKIYKRPIDAICREIMSNSRDANREVGKVDDPIVVGIREGNTLIDASSISLYFKDNGPGISPDRMGNVFCKYAASTKRDTNFQTGGFGLGAKTPFSYTDVFSVETVFDNIKYIYTAYIDETKRGKIVLQSQHEVDEPNGTSIVVPLLSQNDRDKFEMACRYYSMFWPVSPVFENFRTDKTDITIINHDTVDGVTFSLIDCADNILSRGNLLIIDGVPYEVDVDQFGYSTSNSKIAGRYVIALHFENGDLDVSISREALQYTDAVKAKLKAAYDSLQKIFAGWFDTYMDSAVDYLDATMLYYSVLNPTSVKASEMSVKYPMVSYMGFAYNWLKNLGHNFEFKYKGRKLYKAIDNKLIQVQVFKTLSLNDLHTNRYQDISILELYNKIDMMYYLEPNKGLSIKKTYGIFNVAKPQTDGSLMFYLIRTKPYAERNYRYEYDDAAKATHASKINEYFAEFVGEFAEYLTDYHSMNPAKNVVSRKYAVEELTSIKVRTVSKYTKSDDDSRVIYYSKLNKKFYKNSDTTSPIDVAFHAVNTFSDYHVGDNIRTRASFVNKYSNYVCVIINEHGLRYFDGVKTIEQAFKEVSVDKKFESYRTAKAVLAVYTDAIDKGYMDFDYDVYGHKDSVIEVMNKAKKIRKNQTLLNAIKSDDIMILMEDWDLPDVIKCATIELKGLYKAYPIVASIYSSDRKKYTRHLNTYIKAVNMDRKYSHINKLKID